MGKYYIYLRQMLTFSCTKTQFWLLQKLVQSEFGQSHYWDDAMELATAYPKMFNPVTSAL